MKKSTVRIGTWIGAACLMVSAPFAMAHDRSGVNWSISIGSSFPAPMIYGPPPVVYVPVQPIYVQPHRAYVQPHPTYIIPQPIYVQPAPVVRYGRDYNEHYRDHRFSHHERRPLRSHAPHHRHN